MLAAYAFWGYAVGPDGWLKIVLCVLAPLLVAVIWGLFLAPASSRRLQLPLRRGLAFFIFAAAAVLLFTVGNWGAGLVLIVLFGVNQGLLVLWKQD